jgi:hypothetical protein
MQSSICQGLSLKGDPTHVASTLECLCELDGTIGKLRYTAFRLIPYYERKKISVMLPHLVGQQEEEAAEGISSEGENDAMDDKVMEDEAGDGTDERRG